MFFLGGGGGEWGEDQRKTCSNKQSQEGEYGPLHSVKKGNQDNRTFQSCWISANERPPTALQVELHKEVG